MYILSCRTPLMQMACFRQGVDCVKGPWSALVQIQSEYFMAQQVAWSPLSEAFEDYGGFTSVQVT